MEMRDNSYEAFQNTISSASIQLTIFNSFLLEIPHQQICKDHYRAAWPLLLLACSVWTRQREAEERDRTNPNALRTRGPARTRRLYLMLGISLESLCNTQHYSMDDRPAQVRNFRGHPLHLTLTGENFQITDYTYGKQQG